MFLKNSTGQKEGYETHVSKKTRTTDSIYTNLYALLPLQVRVFTYLIGREMTFAENVKWIACNNKGKNQIRINCEHEGQKQKAGFKCM